MFLYINRVGANTNTQNNNVRIKVKHTLMRRYTKLSVPASREGGSRGLAGRQVSGHGDLHKWCPLEHTSLSISGFHHQPFPSFGCVSTLFCPCFAVISKFALNYWSSASLKGEHFCGVKVEVSDLAVSG